MNGRGVDNKLVVGGAARVLAGGNDQRAGIAQLSLTPAERRFRQLCRAKVPIDGAGIQNSQFFQTIGFHNESS